MAKKSSVNIPTIVVLRIIIFLFIGVVLFWIYSRTSHYLNNAPLFNIKDVMIDQSISFIDHRPLMRLKGQNIFSVDTNKLHRQLSQQYPQISQLRVVKQMPDIIMVLAKKRDVLLQFQVKHRYLVVDTEGVTMFYAPSPLSVPLVKGLALENVRIILGASSNVKEVNLMVDLIRQFKAHPQTSRLKIVAVDASNLSKIQLTVMPNIQIITDQEDIARKIDMLEILLNNGKIKWNQVKYIDLRFKEPIIKENTEQES